MAEELIFVTVLIKGIFYFNGGKNSTYSGPIMRGFRPVIWYGKVNTKATSCSFISDLEIKKGERQQVEIVILNETQLNTKIEKGTILNIGSTIDKIGEFTVLEHLGIWNGGRVP